MYHYQKLEGQKCQHLLIKGSNIKTWNSGYFHGQIWDDHGFNWASCRRLIEPNHIQYIKMRLNSITGMSDKFKCTVLVRTEWDR
jgi:hypothetical protein